MLFTHLTKGWLPGATIRTTRILPRPRSRWGYPGPSRSLSSRVSGPGRRWPERWGIPSQAGHGADLARAPARPAGRRWSVGFAGVRAPGAAVSLIQADAAGQRKGAARRQPDPVASVVALTLDGVHSQGSARHAGARRWLTSDRLRCLRLVSDAPGVPGERGDLVSRLPAVIAAKDGRMAALTASLETALARSGRR